MNAQALSFEHVDRDEENFGTAERPDRDIKAAAPNTFEMKG